MMQLVGEIRGISERKVREYTFTSLVVEDENMESHRIDLDQDQTSGPLRDTLEKLKGKVCSIPFYVRQYKTKNGGAGVSFNYAGFDAPKVYSGA